MQLGLLRVFIDRLLEKRAAIVKAVEAEESMKALLKEVAVWKGLQINIFQEQKPRKRKSTSNRNEKPLPIKKTCVTHCFQKTKKILDLPHACTHSTIALPGKICLLLFLLTLVENAAAPETPDKRQEGHWEIAGKKQKSSKKKPVIAVPHGHFYHKPDPCEHVHIPHIHCMPVPAQKYPVSLVPPSTNPWDKLKSSPSMPLTPLNRATILETIRTLEVAVFFLLFSLLTS